MLVFCEECGSRNMIDDSDDGPVVVKFRCMACDYENIWQKPSKSSQTEKQGKTPGMGGKPDHGSTGKRGNN